MRALDLLTKRVVGATPADAEDLPPHPGIARGWRLARVMADRLHLPGPGELADDRGGRSVKKAWATWLAVRSGRVLVAAAAGNRTQLRDSLVDLGVMAVMWAEAVERRGL